jgi:hypothetical protein
LNELLKKFYEKLAQLLDWASFLLSFGFTEESYLHKKLREYSEYLHDKSGGRLPTKADIYTTISAALTYATNTLSSNSWPDRRAQVFITTILSLLTTLSDRQGHNEKLATIIKHQESLIKLLDKTLILLDALKVKKTYSAVQSQIDVGSISASELAMIWKNCYSLEVTLKSNGSIIELTHLEKPGTLYKSTSDTANVASMAIMLANISFVCTSYMSAGSSNVDPMHSPIGSGSLRGLVPITAPTVSPLTAAPTVDPLSDPAITISSVGAIPLRLINDLVAQCFIFEDFKLQAFLTEIVGELEKILAKAITRKKLPDAADAYGQLGLLFEQAGASSELVRKAKELTMKFNAHVKYLATELNARVDIEKEKNNAIAAKDAAILEKISALTERDASSQKEAAATKAKTEAEYERDTLKEKINDVINELKIAQELNNNLTLEIEKTKSERTYLTKDLADTKTMKVELENKQRQSEETIISLNKVLTKETEKLNTVLTNLAKTIDELEQLTRAHQASNPDITSPQALSTSPSNEERITTITSSIMQLQEKLTLHKEYMGNFEQDIKKTVFDIFDLSEIKPDDRAAFINKLINKLGDNVLPKITELLEQVKAASAVSTSFSSNIVDAASSVADALSNKCTPPLGSVHSVDFATVAGGMTHDNQMVHAGISAKDGGIAEPDNTTPQPGSMVMLRRTTSTTNPAGGKS